MRIEPAQDHPMPPYCDANGMRRIIELEAALREIARQCEIADDPEHHTLGLVKNMAVQALAETS